MSGNTPQINPRSLQTVQKRTYSAASHPLSFPNRRNPSRLDNRRLRQKKPSNLKPKQPNGKRGKRIPRRKINPVRYFFSRLNASRVDRPDSVAVSVSPIRPQGKMLATRENRTRNAISRGVGNKRYRRHSRLAFGRTREGRYAKKNSERKKNKNRREKETSMRRKRMGALAPKGVAPQSAAAQDVAPTYTQRALALAPAHAARTFAHRARASPHAA